MVGKTHVSTKPLIAIIEDDDSLRPALGGLVRALGYDSEEFVSAETFLASNAFARAKCLVSDFQLPGVSGMDLAAQLRGLIPVIIITARTEPTLAALAQANGVTCLLHKPFDAEELATCIRCALDSVPHYADKASRGHPD